MASDEHSRDLLARIKAAASNLATDWAKRSGASEGSSPLDAAAEALASTLDRWARNPSVARLVGSVRQDALSGPGESLRLVASPGALAKRGGTARFFIGDEAVTEVPISSGGDIHATAIAPDPGLYAIQVELQPPEGKATRLSGRRMLQVVDGRPVALIDADLFVEADDVAEADVAFVRTLADAGYEVAYFDVHEENRYSDVYAAVQRLGLPQAAIVAVAARDQELAALGVDFLPMFVASTVSRLQSSGVPVTTLVSTRSRAAQEAEARGIVVLPPPAAEARARGGGVERDARRAAALLEAKRTTPALDWKLDQRTGSRLVPGNAFHAELDNARARARLFDAIDQTRSTIHIQLYMVRSSRFTDELIVRLIRRARKGVAVRLLVDALYSDEQLLGRVNDSLRSLRAEDNAEVRVVDPIETRADVTFARLKQRDHRKVTVIDGRRAFVSGRNAADEYYTGFDEVAVHDHTPHGRIPWLDAHLEVTGPMVRQIQQSFVDAWQDHGGGPVDEGNATFPSLEATGGAAGRFVVHHGLADTHGLGMYETLFDEAQTHAYIVNDYPFVSGIEQAIRRMLGRGVRVRILTGSACARRADRSFFPAPPHRALFEYMVKAKLEPLAAAGAEIYEYLTPTSPRIVSRGGRVFPYVHAKAASIDGRATTIGSANLDATASYWETEANILVQDADFATDFEARIQAVCDHSPRIDVTSKAWQDERAQRAVVGTLWPDTLYA